MIHIVELARKARIIVRLGGEDVAVFCCIDFNAGTWELVEDTRGKRTPDVAVQRTCLEHLILR